MLSLAKPAAGLSFGIRLQPNESGCSIGHVRLNWARRAPNYRAVRSIPRPEPALRRYRRWAVQVAVPVAQVPVALELERSGPAPAPERPEQELPEPERPEQELPEQELLEPAGGLTRPAPSPR